MLVTIERLNYKFITLLKVFQPLSVAVHYLKRLSLIVHAPLPLHYIEAVVTFVLRHLLGYLFGLEIVLLPFLFFILYLLTFLLACIEMKKKERERGFLFFFFFIVVIVFYFYFSGNCFLSRTCIILRTLGQVNNENVAMYVFELVVVYVFV